jgi:hypothetical protein
MADKNYSKLVFTLKNSGIQIEMGVQKDLKNVESPETRRLFVGFDLLTGKQKIVHIKDEELAAIEIIEVLEN